MSENNYDKTQYSQYNSAAQEIMRIDDLYKKIHQLRRIGDLDGWNFELDGIWAELASDRNIGPKDADNFYTFMKLYSKNKKNRSLTYQILLKKEVFLRRLQNRLGKGSKYKEQDDSGMF